MSEPKLISPLLDSFIMGDPMSDRGGIKACPAMKKDSDDKYIVKIISIPASPAQLDALLLSGAYSDKADALAYYEGVAKGILDEAAILQKLSSLEGFCSYTDLQLEPMEDGSGFDVYLLSPYRKTLARYFSKNTMTHLGALNLGLDMCAALAVARQSGYIYVALKPENVYLTSDKGFRIGDIGFLKLDTLKYASLPDRYRSAYTAPEIEDAYSSLNTTIDVYAAGMILYQAFNGGILPDVEGELPPPDYADYEIAEIILKACAADPADRWQDPVEMGQAIVSYMQRNGAHDVPIVPVVPAEPAETVTEEAETECEETAITEEEPVSEEAVEEPTTENTTDGTMEEADLPNSEDNHEAYAEDELGNLSFLHELSDDETLPDGDVVELDYEQISVETTDIINQADDLISHPTPDPVIPPEPIEVSLPTVIEDSSDDEVSEESETTSEEAFSEDAEDQPDAEENKATNEVEVSSEGTDQVQQDDDTEENDDDEPTAKPKRHWLRNTIIAVLVLALLAAGFLFYRFFYLQLVDAIHLEGSEDHLTVYVDSEIDDELLTVICTDTYGNQITEDVIDGKAVFEGLAPDSAYTVKLAIKGFHKLEGKTSTAYTTPDRTNIVQFDAKTGSDDGSAIISFTIEGPDADQWKLIYAASGEASSEAIFSGHVYTLTGLNVGTEYNMQLLPCDDLYVTGITETTYLARKLVRAENLTATSCLNGKLELKWDVAEGSQVAKWIVTCRNENGFEKSMEVSTQSAVIDGITDSDSYTIDVTAEGMSVSSEPFVVEANSITISDFTATQASDGSVKLTWNSANAPEGSSFVVSYTADNSPVMEFTANGTSATLAHPVPGANYTFTLKSASDSQILGGTTRLTTKAAEKFSNYGLTASRISLQMCKTPNRQNWTQSNVPRSDRKTNFKLGENASFIMRYSGSKKSSSAQVETYVVVRDQNNNILSITSSTQKWSSMWSGRYATCSISSLPSSAGSYNAFVYFNGDLVGQQSFTVNP